MALPWISANDDGQYIMHEEAASFLRSLPHSEPIGVITVVGRARTGKSFLMNRGILRLKKSDPGFQVSATVNSCTKGLWIYPEIREFTRPDGKTVKAIVIDSEGLSSCESSTNHDTRVFALTLLLSSFFVYNSRGNIDEAAITDLGIITDIVKLIERRQSASDDSTDDITDSQQTAGGMQMPFLLWVVRDFTLQLRSRDGNSQVITELEYLQQELNPETCGSNEGCRRLIRDYFSEMDCLTLVRPCDKESDLCRLATLPNTKIRRPFLQGLAQLQSKIGRHLRHKSTNGSAVCGPLLADLASAYITTLNKGDFPVLEDTLTLISQARNRALTERVIRDFSERLGSIQLPLLATVLREKVNELCAQVTIEWNASYLSGGGGTQEDNPEWMECVAELKRQTLDILDVNSARCAEQNAELVRNIHEYADTEINAIVAPIEQADLVVRTSAMMRECQRRYESACFSESSDVLWNACERELLEKVQQALDTNLELCQTRLQEYVDLATQTICDLPPEEGTLAVLREVRTNMDQARNAAPVHEKHLKAAFFDLVVNSVGQRSAEAEEKVDAAIRASEESERIIKELHETVNDYKEKWERVTEAHDQVRVQWSSNQQILATLETQNRKVQQNLEQSQRELKEVGLNLSTARARELDLRAQNKEMLDTDRVLHIHNCDLKERLREAEELCVQRQEQYAQVIDTAKQLGEAAKGEKLTNINLRKEIEEMIKHQQEEEVKRLGFATRVKRLEEEKNRLESQQNMRYRDWLRGSSSTRLKPPTKRSRSSMTPAVMPEHAQHMRDISSVLEGLRNT